jgi:hypothetical protein
MEHLMKILILLAVSVAAVTAAVTIASVVAFVKIMEPKTTWTAQDDEDYRLVCTDVEL